MEPYIPSSRLRLEYIAPLKSVTTMVWLIGFLLPVYVNVGIIIRCCPPLLAQTCLSYKVTSLPEIRVSKAWHLLTATLGLAKFEVPRELDHQAFAHHRLATRKLGEWSLCKKWHHSVYVKMASPTPVRAKLGLWRVICPLFGAYFAYFSYFLATGMREGLGLSLIHIWRCRRSTLCRSRWSPYH